MNRGVSETHVVTDQSRRRSGLLRALAALLVLAVIVAIVLIVVVRGTSSKSAKRDVTVTACNAADNSKPHAAGTILNHTSKTSIYVIRLKFVDAQGNTVSEGVTSVKSVDPNKTATWQLTGDRGAKGPVRCDTGVSRTNLPGQ